MCCIFFDVLKDTDGPLLLNARFHEVIEALLTPQSLWRIFLAYAVVRRSIHLTFIFHECICVHKISWSTIQRCPNMQRARRRRRRLCTGVAALPPLRVRRPLRSGDDARQSPGCHKVLGLRGHAGLEAPARRSMVLASD